jgi:hypothetical protein
LRRPTGSARRSPSAAAGRRTCPSCGSPGSGGREGLSARRRAEPAKHAPLRP